jgi:putative ABC transport system substrate-binding protein
MAIEIGRRQFISALGGATVAWPLAAHAQQPAMPVIGFLSYASPDAFGARLRAFRQGLKEIGYIEGQNLTIEYRWVGENYDRLPEAAADLVQRRVVLIFAAGTPATLAAKAATATIPIVFNTGGDPVRLGLVSSMNRPSGNVTGVAFIISELVTKQFSLLHNLLPKASVVGFLTNLANSQTESQIRDAAAAAQTLGLHVIMQRASSTPEIETALANLVQQRVEALIVGADGFFSARRDQLIALASRYSIPAIYDLREFVEAGGLMSYGTSITDALRQAGVYVGRILKGEKTTDLPVIQSTKFELVLNLKTAKALDIRISDNLLSIADEVIE